MRIAVLIAFFFMLAAPVHGQQVEDSAKAATDTSQAKLRQRKGLDKKEIGEPRVNNAPLYPEAKGFIEIPHTGGAEFRIGGSVRLDMMRDFEPAGEAALFVPSTIPVTGVTPGDENSFNMDIMPTRLTLEVRRPSDMGPMRAYFEFNMFGPDGTTGFNIWNAYVQAANILVGLAYSPFMDIDAFPVTVDFEGPNSAAFLIVPQIRYTLPLHRHWNLGLGLMQPQSEVQLPSVLAAPVNSAPDVSLRLRREEGWGHVQLGFVGRDLGYGDPDNTYHAFGYGLQGSAAITVNKNEDAIQLSAIYGQGIARYVNDLTGFELDASTNADGSLDPLTAWGGYVGYQHYWTETLSSQVVAGFLWMDNVDSQPFYAFRETQYYSANVIWHPHPVFALGLEWLHGVHKQKDGESASANRLQAGFQFFFYDGS